MRTIRIIPYYEFTLFSPLSKEELETKVLGITDSSKLLNTIKKEKAFSNELYKDRVDVQIISRRIPFGSSLKFAFVNRPKGTDIHVVIKPANFHLFFMKVLLAVIGLFIFGSFVNLITGNFLGFIAPLFMSIVIYVFIRAFFEPTAMRTRKLLGELFDCPIIINQEHINSTKNQG